ALTNYINTSHGSPHRGAHKLSIKATDAYDKAREKVRAFIGAKSASECVFTRNSTESLNLIAYGYLMKHMEAGDKMVTAITAHHSAILPLQMVAEKKGAILEYLYCDEHGDIPESELEKID
ncbi:cysteine desulfurase, partial [Aduncisulcus paluster]